MYSLPYYKESDLRVITAFIEKYPFAFLTGCDAQSRPVATQVPMFLDQRNGHRFLSGHIMRNTDHHRAFVHNANVLAVFTGAHAYVSGAWYSDPHTASTWNYMSVHARGSIRFIDGDALEQMLRRTTLHFENNDADSPTVFDNLSEEFKRKAMKAIVAFEIEVTELDNVFKLSQDRDKESYLNIIEKLKESGEDGRAIAAEMEQRAGRVFPDD